MKNIISDIKNKTFRKLYLFTGQEVFLEEYYLNSLIDTVTDGSKDDFNTMTVSREVCDEMSIVSFIDSYPLMSEKKILVLKNTGLLKKSTEDEKRFWTKLLDDIPDYAIIAFLENETDKRSSIYKSISKNGYIGEFPLQTGSSLITWVSKIIKANGKQMDRDVIEYLILSCNPGMINLKNEIEKLVSYKKDNPVITKQDVDTLVTKTIESKVFEMAEDIAKGNISSAQKKLEDLKKLNTKPPEILPAVFSKFSSYKKIKLLEHLPASQIAIQTKSRDFFVKKDLALIKKLSIKQLNNVIKLCQNADYRIKSGQSDGWYEITSIIISCK